ncbi:MAG: hypothetical protein ACRESQ_08940, partial [Gammaproteobacteria bacterium]
MMGQEFDIKMTTLSTGLDKNFPAWHCGVPDAGCQAPGDPTKLCYKNIVSSIGCIILCERGWNL